MLLKVAFTNKKMFQCFREIENLREKWQDLISKLTVCSPCGSFVSKDGYVLYTNPLKTLTYSGPQ